MKNLWFIVLLTLVFIGGYYFGFSNNKVITKTKTITKIDTISYTDTVYKYIAKIKRTTVTDTLVKKDSLYLHDTVFVSYSSPFRLGTDTLNCSGNVMFDMQRFYFSGIRFKYPRRIIYNTEVVSKVNWWYVAGAFVGGIVFDNYLRKK